MSSPLEDKTNQTDFRYFNNPNPTKKKKTRNPSSLYRKSYTFYPKPTQKELNKDIADFIPMNTNNAYKMSYSTYPVNPSNFVNEYIYSSNSLPYNSINLSQKMTKNNFISLSNKGITEHFKSQRPKIPKNFVLQNSNTNNRSRKSHHYMSSNDYFNDKYTERINNDIYLPKYNNVFEINNELLYLNKKKNMQKLNKALEKFTKLKYLNKNDLKRLISDEYQEKDNSNNITLLKKNRCQSSIVPNYRRNDSHISLHKSQNYNTNNINNINNIKLDNETNDDFDNYFSNKNNNILILTKINNLYKNKLFLSNASDSKKKQIYEILKKNVKNINKNIDYNNLINDNTDNITFNFNKFTMFDKFMMSIYDKDECIYDYIQCDKPFDMTRKFKNLCIQERKNKDLLLNNLKIFIHRNKELLKIYSGRLRSEQNKLKRDNFEV